MKGRNPLFAEGLVDLTCIITWVLYGGWIFQSWFTVVMLVSLVMFSVAF